MRKDIIVHEMPKSPIAESIRLLRTNLSFLCNSEKMTFLLTSSMPGEGKTWVSSNLAIAFAQANKKVLLIDADLRKGRLHKVFNKYNKIGFSDFLNDLRKIKNDVELQTEILKKLVLSTEVENLSLLPSGMVPPNPSELLEECDFEAILELLKTEYDVIIIDMPPVSIVTDSLVLCDKVDYVILVASVEQTKKDMLLNSKKSIQQVGGRLAGVVLNKMPIGRRKDYNQYYQKYSSDMGTTRSKGISKLKKS